MPDVPQVRPCGRLNLAYEAKPRRRAHRPRLAKSVVIHLPQHTLQDRHPPASHRQSDDRSPASCFLWARPAREVLREVDTLPQCRRRVVVHEATVPSGSRHERAVQSASRQ